MGAVVGMFLLSMEVNIGRNPSFTISCLSLGSKDKFRSNLSVTFTSICVNENAATNKE